MGHDACSLRLDEVDASGRRTNELLDIDPHDLISVEWATGYLGALEELLDDPA